MTRKRKFLRHIGWAVILIAIYSFESFIWLRDTGLLEEFQFRDIFFKGGVFDDYRICDMRMTITYCLMQLPRAMGYVWKWGEYYG